MNWMLPTIMRKAQEPIISGKMARVFMPSRPNRMRLGAKLPIPMVMSAPMTKEPPRPTSRRPPSSPRDELIGDQAEGPEQRRRRRERADAQVVEEVGDEADAQVQRPGEADLPLGAGLARLPSQAEQVAGPATAERGPHDGERSEDDP